ncbi:Ig-like domain-containing protein [Algibacter sp. 2305UL17-15]|uniref:Ig-like domain-containing protein n=1 Tax=Algibacter sp. 2305UL17-15 TaxID=3231268 RepID=UPI0034575046
MKNLLPLNLRLLLTLLPNFKVLIILLFLALFLPSCNNEEIYVVEENLLIEEIPEEEEEEEPNNEDENQLPAPEAIADNYTTLENTELQLDVHINDKNLTSVATISRTDPANGILSLNDNNTPDNPMDDIILYTPNPDYFGIDSFEYTLCDAATPENCSTAIVTIVVEEVVEIVDDIATELKAFPTAYGAGANATGGRGGEVIHVTNLNDSGPGSLRDALAQTYPRIIVFDVSGEINHTSNLSAGSGNFTIAGHTAPEGGITLTGSRIYISFADNIIIKNIRFRNGSASQTGDCITMPQCSNVIIDHCSFALGGDESIDFDSSQNDGNITIQNCLLYECKTGILLGGTPTSGSGEFSILRNVISNTSHRFPKTNGAVKLDVINNLIHNWRYRTLRLDASVSSESFTLNLIGNYYQSGNNTVASSGGTGQGIHKVSTGNGTSSPQIWSRYNHIDQDILNAYSLSGYDENTDESSAWSSFPSTATKPVKLGWLANSQLALKGIAPTILDNESLKAELLPTVGASQYLNADGSVGFYRDALDIEAVALVKDDGSAKRTGSAANLYDKSGRANVSIPATPRNTRPEGYDTDKDGMPNVWEVSMGFDPNVNDSSEDKDGDGYTNLEEFLY